MSDTGAPMGFGPGGIDCSEVLEDVYLYLDDESDPAVRERIRIHLEDCAPCFREFGLEQDLKSLIARCCGGDVAPDTLRSTIRVRLTQTVIETVHVEYRAD